MNCIPDIVLPKDCTVDEATEIARKYVATAQNPNGYRVKETSRKMRALREFLFQLGLVVISSEDGVQHIVSVENPL